MFCYDPGGNRPSEAVYCDVTLFVFENSRRLPPDHFVRVVADLFTYDKLVIARRDTLHLNRGQVAYVYALSGNAGRMVRLVFLEKRGVLVVLRGHWGGPLFERGPGVPGEAERRVLSSFRFLGRGGGMSRRELN
jgi:hypothetical protein